MILFPDVSRDITEVLLYIVGKVEHRQLIVVWVLKPQAHKYWALVLPNQVYQ